MLKKITVKNAEYINVDSNSSLEYWKKAGINGNYGVIQNVVEIMPRYFNHIKNINDDIKRDIHISILIEAVGKNGNIFILSPVSRLK